ncbi:FAD-binding oxidoreductase [Hydromonas duriensis]|uniref:FAD/FMN-containing dehydrogenase n=1 Tax=Hydromonas duriensis TaxID=1527608 RepID=A0A4R6YB43_9BURK|nr:FAD-binding oxidoreductase [Hydromonas duriensis]TDR32831.1 FAD/FMN-containing dehydrogenase [Hydromonas duriensis]
MMHSPHRTHFLKALITCVGEAHLLTDEAAKPFTQDERNRYHHPALAVVFPKTTEQVARIVQLCANHQPPIAIIPQGGNTGLVGGCAVLTHRDSILLNLSRMQQVLDIDRDNRTMTLQAGVTLEQAQQTAEAHQLLFPLTLASQNAATIGGNLATNAGGTQVLRYGNMRDLCLGLEVVLPTGEVWQGLNRLRKNNTGYDLKHLFIGAEGTLGIITAAVLKLFPAPQQTQVAMLAAPSVAGIARSFDVLQRQFDAQLTAFEYISPSASQLVCAQFNWPPLFSNHNAHVALIELSHAQPDASLNEQLQNQLSQLIDNQTLDDVLMAQNLNQANNFWRMREHISAAQKRTGPNIKHDISVPISAIVPFIEQTTLTLEQAYSGIQPIVFGHMGDGNLHFNISCGRAFATSEQLMARERDINNMVYEKVTQFGGSISAEHGIGLLKRDLMPSIKSAVELNMMRQLKNTFDPLNIMNPEKIITHN